MNVPFSHVRIAVICLAVALGTVSPVRAVIVARGPPETPIVHFNTAPVNGRQALVWEEVAPQAPAAGGKLKYVRATDADGLLWEAAPQTLDNDVAEGAVIGMVNGNPAVCYFKPVANKLAFLRAVDPAGSAWGAPVLIDIGELPPSRLALGVAASPVVTFVTGPADTPSGFCVAATNAAGTAWGAPVSIGTESMLSLSMEVVDGLPAVAFVSGGFAFYRRATHPSGSTWGPPVKALPTQVNSQGSDVAMRLVAERPAICCFADSTNSRMKYVRATGLEGAAWGAPVDASGFGPVVALSMAVVGGRPAMTCKGSTFTQIFYGEATDSTGTAWVDTRALSDPIRFWKLPQAFNSGGLPALMHIEGLRNNIEVTRAVSGQNGPNGLLWPPTALVSNPNGFERTIGGGTFAFEAAAGARLTRTFNLSCSNSTCEKLVVSAVSLSGPDAADFTLDNELPPAVLRGSFTPFDITFAPRTIGSKTAVLDIVTNSMPPDDHFIMNLKGVSTGPEIVVRRTGGEPLADGEALPFPVTVPGTPLSVEFTVTNQQTIALEDIAVTLDGPDAAEYAVSAAPAPSVPPGGSTTFTIQHAPQAAGGRMAALHIATSLAPGPLSPFDLSLRMVPGSLDESFRPNGANVNCLAVRPDGRILAGGAPFIIALNSDGTFDSSFSPPFIGQGSVDAIAVQRDGRLLIGGSFAQVGSLTRPGLARLMENGAPDSAFDARVGINVSCISLQPDGKILAGGNFQTTAGTVRRWLVRLHADGTQDDTFQPVLDNAVSSLALLPDGKLLAGGAFTSASAVPAPFLARLHPDGMRDAFSAALDQPVQALALRPDGGILAGRLSGGLLLLQPDGTPAPGTGALTANAAVHSLALQADGQCLAGGAFTQLAGQPRSFVGRFTAAGAMDPWFTPHPDHSVRAVALQADGKVLLAGAFSEIDSVSASFVARLLNAPATSSLFRTGGTVRWLRGGTAPEVSSVTFEMQAAGASVWQMLGTPHAVPGGWELSGLTLPSSGKLRARGRTGGSLHESVTPLQPPLESWRLQYFNTPDNTGDAADDADPDRDGLTNFTEFAFGLSPVDRTSNALPEFTYTNGSLTAAFTAPEGRDDVLYGAERSATLLPGSWTVIPDTAVAPAHSFSAPAGPRVFMRYKVRMR